MIAWVTGGGTGIGRALTEELVRQGAKVVISGRRREVLEEAAQDIRSKTPSAEIFAVAGDVSDASHGRALVGDVKDRWGDIDLLINNAGSNTNRSFRIAPPEEYRQAFENNCLSAIHAVQAVLPGMLAAKRGAIVNISSIYGKWASASSASYSVSKHALTGYSDVLRQGLIGTGVHVLGVYPGFIRTPMTLPFVRTGSLRSRVGKSPEQIAKAILRAVRKKKGDLYYPWYVSWVLRFHRWAPLLADRGAMQVKR